MVNKNKTKKGRKKIQEVDLVGVHLIRIDLLLAMLLINDITTLFNKPQLCREQESEMEGDLWWDAIIRDLKMNTRRG